jgi:cytidyltransferase-like protein
MKILLTESGNIFDSTQRINKADVLPTVQWLERILGLNLRDHMLGTTGEKDTSGDLDLGVDESSITKDELVERLKQWAKNNKVPDSEILNSPKAKFKGGWIAKTGTIVHFKTPIRGNPQNGFVQTDFMFTPDMEWTKYSLSGTPEIDSPFKGADKHMLLSKLAKVSDPTRPMSWSYLNGLLDSETREVISKNPDEIAKIVLGPKATRDTLRSVERILQYIRNNNLVDKFASQIEAYRTERGVSEHDINRILRESKFLSFRQMFLKEQGSTVEVGFFPGAFKPLHKGHIKAIQKAAAEVNGPLFVVVSKGSRSSDGGMEFTIDQTMELFNIYGDLLPSNVHVVRAGVSPLATVLQSLVILNNGKFVLGKAPKKASGEPPPDPESLVEPETREIINKVPSADHYTAKLAVGDDPKDLTRFKSAFADERYVGRKLSAVLIETLKGWSATIFRNGLDDLDKQVIKEYIPAVPGHPIFIKILKILYGKNNKLVQAVKMFKNNK